MKQSEPYMYIAPLRWFRSASDCANVKGYVLTFGERRLLFPNGGWAEKRRSRLRLPTNYPGSASYVIGAASGQGHDEDDSRRYQERDLGKLANLINPP